MRKPDLYQAARASVSKGVKKGYGSPPYWTEYLFMPFDLFHLLFRLATDDNVSTIDKAKLAGAIIYILSPIDIMPEMLFGPLGLLDDLALGVYVVNGIINKTIPDVLRSYWAGSGRALEKLRAFLKIADRTIGAGLIKKLRGRF